MKTSDVNIRDPYILPYNGRYYLYGTRSETCWGMADGFDCYISEDLEEWKGPIEIFHKPEEFFADRCYWAPECYYYGEAFYLVTTFGAEHLKKGIYILRAEKPEGPFILYSERITPPEWACIDGTLHFENEKPYLIFSHSFEDTADGDMCILELSKDLKQAAGEPIKLFSAVEASWAMPVPFAKQEFGMDGDVYFTDGPCIIRLDSGELVMTWSSWGGKGYAIGQAISESGNIQGSWKQVDEPVFPENGGHGMMFKTFDGVWNYVLHSPNEKYMERPCFQKVAIENGTLKFI